MTTPAQLLRTTSEGAAPPVRWDALRDEDALLESGLIDLRFLVTERTVGLLFDLRTASMPDVGNVAVVVARAVRTLSWEHEPGEGRHRWYPCVGSVPAVHQRTWTITLSFLSGRLVLEAGGASSYVGVTPSIPAAPPDFGDDPEEVILAGLPSWDAPFHVVAASHLDPVGEGSPDR